ncbi:hypothetical protein KY289_003496 [Solanum tuberosum]|nr:hypothetical protein KY289_003496 [Solanum tuberosum]
MIKGVILMNDKGKPRLAKFYDYHPAEKQQELIRRLYGVLSSRAENVSNFVKVDSLFGPDARLVYKTYATLHILFIFDSSENELAMLDLMQVFVETMDKCFSNVRELDIVFNFNKVHAILDEIILGGQVLETSSSEVVKAVEEIYKMERAANSIMAVPSITSWQVPDDIPPGSSLVKFACSYDFPKELLSRCVQTGLDAAVIKNKNVIQVRMY